MQGGHEQFGRTVRDQNQRGIIGHYPANALLKFAAHYLDVVRAFDIACTKFGRTACINHHSTRFH